MCHKPASPLLMALALLLGVAGGLASTSPAATDQDELWIAGQGTSTEYIVNFLGERLAQLSFPAGAGPHITTFHSPDIAYVGGMGDGHLYVIDANARQIIQTLALAPSLAHQAKPSPDVGPGRGISAVRCCVRATTATRRRAGSGMA